MVGLDEGYMVGLDEGYMVGLDEGYLVNQGKQPHRTVLVTFWGI